MLVALRFCLHRPLSSKQSDAMCCLTTKQARQLCAEPGAAEHVDDKVEGVVEVAVQNGNTEKEIKIHGIVQGRVRIN
ncbi:hypothetical protein DPMN_020990 [Dreissena polymorpha]|uniref:Uncharacterized protein n=1 Tax=Dreissena polymorpha TaxID=45954 RepID=A0A9D4NNG6_DREPO|nr:hypothetical protein DPMN_020985 [Dreissena polymorpha]KAH3896809.1 hypothetical protein DPMN_020990 [Dreissena polymorpha]